MNLGNCCGVVLCQKGTWKVSSARVVVIWLGIFPSSQPIGPGQPHLASGSIQYWVSLSSGSAVWGAAGQQGSCPKWWSYCRPHWGGRGWMRSVFGHISSAVTQTWLKHPLNPTLTPRSTAPLSIFNSCFSAGKSGNSALLYGSVSLY